MCGGGFYCEILLEMKKMRLYLMDHVMNIMIEKINENFFFLLFFWDLWTIKVPHSTTTAIKSHKYKYKKIIINWKTFEIIKTWDWGRKMDGKLLPMNKWKIDNKWRKRWTKKKHCFIILHFLSYSFMRFRRNLINDQISREKNFLSFYLEFVKQNAEKEEREWKRWMNLSIELIRKDSKYENGIIYCDNFAICEFEKLLLKLKKN